MFPHPKLQVEALEDGQLLTVASGNSVTVGYATGSGSATAGSDYMAANSTVTLAPGETTKTFSVTIINDSAYEWDETVPLSLFSPVNASLGSQTSAVLTITDNDSPPVLSFTVSTPTVGEADGAATITVWLTGFTALTVTADYATANISATAGSDYTTASGTLTFAPGESSKSCPVRKRLSEESFWPSLSNRDVSLWRRFTTRI